MIDKRPSSLEKYGKKAAYLAAIIALMGTLGYNINVMLPVSMSTHQALADRFDQYQEHSDEEHIKGEIRALEAEKRALRGDIRYYKDAGNDAMVKQLEEDLKDVMEEIKKLKAKL